MASKILLVKRTKKLGVAVLEPWILSCSKGWRCGVIGFGGRDVTILD